MAVTTTQTNKPINPRGNDQSPKGYNRAALYSGKALDFDGVNDEVDLDGFTMSGNTASFAFYLKADEWNAGDFIFDSRPTRLSIGGDSANANTLNIRSGTSWLKLADISDTTNTNHFVITIDGTTAKLFLNGQSFGYEVTLSSEIDLSSNANTALMSYSAGASSYFNGQMSGFKIFNTALTAAQVADLYNNPEKVVPTGVDNTALKLWLPMQEGAGTTAYDGSGNGNHGTISGATWTHGIGAPVSQTAVIDWNKSSNLLQNSEGFNSGNWFKILTSATADSSTAPNGTTTADTLTTTNSGVCYIYQLISTASGAYTLSTYAKNGNNNFIALNAQQSGNSWVTAVFDLSDGTIGEYAEGAGGGFVYVSHDITSVGDGWYKCSLKFTHSLSSIYPVIMFAPLKTGNSFTSNYGETQNNALGKTIDVWGASLSLTDNGDVYIPTLATAQTSPVLLPQGLTSGRDITGVNLFENVRKQGALNLDGNSWAEVHDNASIDLSDANASFEAWVYYDFTATSNNYIFNKLVSAGYRIRIEPGGNFGFYMSDGTTAFGDGGSFPLVADSWNHLVLTTDGTNFKRYINGSLADTDISGTALTSLSNDDDLYIGSNQTPADYMPTQIAQPRIYNRALTAEEVQRNYDAGKNIYTNS